MALIGTRPHTGPASEQNRADWRILLDELSARRSAAALGGSERARERHVGRGKLLTRERIARLLDPNSPTSSKLGRWPPMACTRATCMRAG